MSIFSFVKEMREDIRAIREIEARNIELRNKIEKLKIEKAILEKLVSEMEQ